jgi:hypothetical protein
MNLIAAFGACCFFDKKPALRFDILDKAVHQLHKMVQKLEYVVNKMALIIMKMLWTASL